MVEAKALAETLHSGAHHIVRSLARVDDSGKSLQVNCFNPLLYCNRTSSGSHDSSPTSRGS